MVAATIFPYEAVRFGIMNEATHLFGCSTESHDFASAVLFSFSFGVCALMAIDFFALWVRASLESTNFGTVRRFYETVDERAAPLIKFTKGWWCVLAGLIVIAICILIDYTLC